MIAPIHPKAMPVILHPEDYQSWLDGGDAQSLAVPFPSQLLKMAEWISQQKSRADNAG